MKIVEKYCHRFVPTGNFSHDVKQIVSLCLFESHEKLSQKLAEEFPDDKFEIFTCKNECVIKARDLEITVAVSK
jgi:hypothetical protein